MNAALPDNRIPAPGVLPRMLNKIKPFLITAIVAILAVALFSRFAPAWLQNLLTGATAPAPSN